MIKRQPFFLNGRYANSPTERPHAVLLPSVAIYIRMLWHTWGMPVSRTWCAPIHPDDLPRAPEPFALWIGHSTVLLRVNGMHILTDPIFGAASFLFPRIMPPGLDARWLPKIDLVLISHNHRDHLDHNAIKLLVARNPRTQFLVPMGDRQKLFDLGAQRVVECGWWDSVPISGAQADVHGTCTYLPAKHWSQHGLFDRNRALWGSWMIDVAGTTIYFGGDTAYDSHFLEIAREFPSIDTALLPVGPCEPWPFMEHMHMNAAQAGRAFTDLGARRLVPIHWGTFRFGVERPELPVSRLRTWWAANTSTLLGKELLLAPAGTPLSLAPASLWTMPGEHGLAL